jgi:hypothetical protein
MRAMEIIGTMIGIAGCAAFMIVQDKIAVGLLMISTVWWIWMYRKVSDE